MNLKPALLPNWKPANWFYNLFAPRQQNEYEKFMINLKKMLL